MKIAYHNLIIDTATGIGTEATITVYNAGTVDLSTIYSDPAGTAKDNPFSTDAYGRFSFYANPDEYDIKVSGVDIVTYTIEDVSIMGDYAQFVTSAPTSGQYRVKKLRLNSDLNVLLTYDETPEV